MNPATEELLAEVARGDAEDVDFAVRAARDCFDADAWRGLSARHPGVDKITFTGSTAVGREAIRAGTNWINTYNLYDAGVPFGGFGASGYGRDAVQEYVEKKTVWVNLG